MKPEIKAAVAVTLQQPTKTKEDLMAKPAKLHPATPTVQLDRTNPVGAPTDTADWDTVDRGGSN